MGPGPHTLTWDHHGLHPLTQTEHLATSPDQQEVDRRFFAIITGPDGTTAWQAHTTLWGTTSQAKNTTTTTPLRFPGQYYDPETGLHYNVHRHYDPQTARYLTPDPLGLAPAPNPVAYVDNPHRWSDPLGLAPCLKRDLKNWKNQRYQFGNENFMLSRDNIEHILTRHHPKYWDGSVKASQSFFDQKMSIPDVQDAISQVLKQNRDKLITKGTRGMYQLEGTVNGVKYVVGLNRGHIGQFYPGSLSK
ncbi:RHS repeat-associated protein [Kitasatospora sp. GAS204A]|nr:RHS repeat-associated protein [Kitasatospora sp. GAS204B]